MGIEESEIIKSYFGQVVATFRDNININDNLAETEVEELCQYLEILNLWNKKIDLVSPQSVEMLIGKHLIDSAIVSRFISSNLNLKSDYCYVDVGSGAGFPGAILGLLERQRKVYLIEPREKRCFFLKEIKRQLKLENVEIIRSRVEDYAIPAEKVGAVTNRALGMRDCFLKEARRLLSKNGYVIELLTSKSAVEPESLKKAETLFYSLPPDNSSRVVAAYSL